MVDFYSTNLRHVQSKKSLTGFALREERVSDLQVSWLLSALAFSEGFVGKHFRRHAGSTGSLTNPKAKAGMETMSSQER